MNVANPYSTGFPYWSKTDKVRLTGLYSLSTARDEVVFLREIVNDFPSADELSRKFEALYPDDVKEGSILLLWQ